MSHEGLDEFHKATNLGISCIVKIYVISLFLSIYAHHTSLFFIYIIGDVWVWPLSRIREILYDLEHHMKNICYTIILTWRSIRCINFYQKIVFDMRKRQSYHIWYEKKMLMWDRLTNTEYTMKSSNRWSLIVNLWDVFNIIVS